VPVLPLRFRRFGFTRSLAWIAFAWLNLFSQPLDRSRDGAAATAIAWQRFVIQSHGVLSTLNRPESDPLPAAVAGVTDLSFAEFFGPIGDRGLEYSAKLRSLHGLTVRLAGYMIRESERAAGLFRLVARPLNIDQGCCAIDNAPPSAVHVFLNSPRLVPYRPGRLVLIGRLEIGPRIEADGRNSTVRLILDDALPGAAEP
jgi:hypothetical protein